MRSLLSFLSVVVLCPSRALCSRRIETASGRTTRRPAFLPPTVTTAVDHGVLPDVIAFLPRTAERIEKQNPHTPEVDADAVLPTTTNPIQSQNAQSSAIAPIMSIRGGGLVQQNLLSSSVATCMSIRGGGPIENAEFVGLAYDWAVNLGAPATLVAGAVVATMYENVRGGALEVLGTDSAYTKFAKQLTTYLLITSFAMQIVSIFVTTVTGTMLLSRDANAIANTSGVASRTALEYLKNNFEFEYLTSRLSFLQGLLNWLGAVAVEHTIRRPEESPYTRKVNLFIASSLGTLILMILSFYNAHMGFYENYGHMVYQWCTVMFHRYFLQWRPMAVAYVPSVLVTIILGIRSFLAVPSSNPSKKSKSH